MNTEESARNGDTSPPPAPAPAPEEAPPVGPEPTAAAEGPAPRARRRVARTLALLAVAAVFGLVGGTAVGYGVQAQREPDPLPPLNQPGLAYPAKPLPKGQEPEPLPASEDRQAKAQGDLRKLLLPRPAGARAAGTDGWQSVSSYAEEYLWPEHALERQLDLRIRRVASRAWRVGEHRRVAIDLVQYRPGAEIGALAHVTDQQRLALQDDEAGSLGEAVKGSGNGRYFLYPVDRRPGYLDYYRARAFIQRGDIAIFIVVSDTKKIAAKDIRSLAERQLERL